MSRQKWLGDIWIAVAADLMRRKGFEVVFIEDLGPTSRGLAERYTGGGGQVTVQCPPDNLPSKLILVLHELVHACFDGELYPTLLGDKYAVETVAELAALYTMRLLDISSGEVALRMMHYSENCFVRDQPILLISIRFFSSCEIFG